MADTDLELDLLKGQREEIVSELEKPQRLRRELAQIDKRIAQLEAQAGVHNVHVFYGVVVREKTGNPVGKAVCEMEDGSIIRVPDNMTPEEAKKIRRVWSGGRRHEVSAELADRLQEAGFEVVTETRTSTPGQVKHSTVVYS